MSESVIPVDVRISLRETGIGDAGYREGRPSIPFLKCRN